MRSVLPAFSGLDRSDFTSAAAFSVRRTTGSLVTSASIFESNLIAGRFPVKFLADHSDAGQILDSFAFLFFERRRELRKFLRHAIADVLDFPPLLHIRSQAQCLFAGFLRPELIAAAFLQEEAIEDIQVKTQRLKSQCTLIRRGGACSLSF